MDSNVYGVNKAAYHHGDLSRAALEAAIGILEEEGLERLSLRAVAAKVGVTAMALYRHFADKAALLSAIGRHGFVLLGERLDEVGSEGAPVDVLTAWGLAYMRFVRDHRDLYRLMFGAPPAWQSRADRAALPDRPETAFGRLTALMRSAVPPEEVEYAVLSAWSFVHGLATLVSDGRLNPFEDDAEQLATDLSRFFAVRLLGQSGKT